MIKLKINDRVRVLLHEDQDTERFIGDTGTVLQNSRVPNVLMDNGITMAFLEEELELIKEEQGMQKSDLKTGMLVKTRESWYIVLLDVDNHGENKSILQDLSLGGFLNFTSFTDDLKCRNYDTYDITTVATVNCPQEILKAIRKEEPIESISSFKILWTRENPQSTQLKTIIGDLEKQLADAKVKLGALND
jgi:hypothetical protein